jgi:hypothetical protein
MATSGPSGLLSCLTAGLTIEPVASGLDLKAYLESQNGYWSILFLDEFQSPRSRLLPENCA